ncbi:lichenan permease iic component (pts system lichenan-specific eiiccomponent) (eiic-lic) [Streptococcus pneumoniae]|uniref:PTS sugar transporter subunit IIC n=1 Tax=Streptococcus pneumoniae TaxID=1313 RepID=UPI0005E5AD4F|nr:PTS sugar transporter subunit IIC [Streptococcus pneumoniae]CEX17987.1 lichenan permease iic component (pts system lichenan-specific eiiccomponent) (eiic-lic) [Streptococcus pneumoniae]CEY56578.1 lichenan permease iic component (pts system lichenan-specific eiiccomponent) (eiic-lic) [Streptococcus pneumoniae]CIQ39628.1 lichenan permease iic component (pts system lichenan-specific eiiccomponent) (eiic-lic) [Streptococcus pneumoniae]CIR06097.1 lichenan permease iic component (pts system lichen
MEKLLQEKLLPVAARLGNNKALVSIRDGITLTIPLLLIGSLLMVIASFPIPGWEKYLGDIGVADYLWKGVDSSFGLLGLVASFGIAYFMARQYKVDGIPAGIVSLSSFITVTPFITGEAGAGMPTAFMASKGLFVAMILGLINGYIYQWFINHNIQIKMPDGVPPAVSKSFSAIILGAVTIVGWLIVYATLDKLSLPNLHEIAQGALGGPLGLLGNNVIGLLILIFLNSSFWFVGLHGGNVVNAVMKPLWLANLDANKVAYQTGETLPNIFTSVFMDNFVFIGGGGATIGLVLALGYLAHKKKASKQLKTLAPITVIPGLFNINEPAMFGVPIVLNILLLVPFILAPMFNLLVAWGAMASGLVPLTYTDPGWTMPPVISGLLATGSISGSLLQIVLIVLDVLLYLPFVIAIEKRFKLLED